jgi:hypothetical protein
MNCQVQYECLDIEWQETSFAIVKCVKGTLKAKIQRRQLSITAVLVCASLRVRFSEACSASDLIYR